MDGERPSGAVTDVEKVAKAATPPKEEALDASDDAVAIEMPDGKNTEKKIGREVVAPLEVSKFVAVVSNVEGYSGNTTEEKVKAFTTEHSVAIFSKTYCPFCLEVKRTFAELGVPVHVIEVDSIKDGAKIHEAAKRISGLKTVPNVFIKGEHIGGCDDVKKLQSSRSLEPKIRDLVTIEKVIGNTLDTVQLSRKDRGKALHPLMWFPNTVNNWVVRGTGSLVVIVCILGIIFRDETWGQFLVVGLLVDFISRMLIGSYASLLGMLATLLTSPLKPDFRPGPPKQFAGACGTFFSAVTVGLFFGGETTGGAIVLGLLMGAAAMEAFLDFCLGCLFFGWGIRFGIIPEHIYSIHNNTCAEIKHSWDYLNLDSKAEKPEWMDTDLHSKIALKYKSKKTDEYTKDDFHVIRNMQVSYFAMPMSIAGLAVAWKVASFWLEGFLQALVPGTLFLGPFTVFSLASSTAWYQTFAIVAAIIFCTLLLLYMARAMIYPRKCLKEWQCPLRSGGFGMITITLMLFAFLVYDVTYTTVFGRVLWWIGALLHMVLTVIKFGELLGKRLEIEHVHASWLILPVGNLVAALVAPIIPALKISDDKGSVVVDSIFGPNYSTELASFFFSFGFLMWIVLLTITLFKAMTTHNSDDRVRTQLFIWIAAPCVASLAFLVIESVRGNFTPSVFAFSAQLFYVGIVFFLGLTWACMPYIGFFGRMKFGMAYWNVIFPLDTLAAAAAVYFGLTGFQIGRVLLIVFLSLASLANGLAFLHTLVALYRRREVFTPEKKWGPLSFMKLTHESLRSGLPLMTEALETIDLTNLETVQIFAARFVQFEILHEEHSKHEDEVVFKRFNDFFDEHAKQWNDDHEEHRQRLSAWMRMTETLLDKDIPVQEKGGILSTLQKEIPPFVDHVLEHLRGEEFHLNPIGRKYVPLAMQKELSRRCFEITPAKHWEVIIPYVVNNLPRHPQRVTYLKALFWSMPEKTQQIGAIVYRNVDAVMWERIRVDVPEMIPRGEFNWWRYY